VEVTSTTVIFKRSRLFWSVEEVTKRLNLSAKLTLSFMTKHVSSPCCFQKPDVELSRRMKSPTLDSAEVIPMLREYIPEAGDTGSAGCTNVSSVALSVEAVTSKPTWSARRNWSSLLKRLNVLVVAEKIGARLDFVESIEISP